MCALFILPPRRPTNTTAKLRFFRARPIHRSMRLAGLRSGAALSKSHPARGRAATLGIDAAEPSIGVNWLSETGTNGGRSMYIALLETLRVTFDDTCPSSPSSLWEDKSFLTTAAADFRSDPLHRSDDRTHASFTINFPGRIGLSASGFTDNDGDLWGQSTGAGTEPASITRRSAAAGLPRAARLFPPIRIRLLLRPASGRHLRHQYRWRRDLRTGRARVPAWECGGLHGHIKVGPDGTAYLPNKGCGTGQGMVVTEDNGGTWEVRAVPGSTAGGSDAAVGIGRGDATGGVGRVYLGYADGDNRAVIATTTDRGLTWSQPLDVGAAFGINNVAFPAVVAGDDAARPLPFTAHRRGRIAEAAFRRCLASLRRAHLRWRPDLAYGGCDA